MARHERKLCPRCGVEFECKSGSVALCQCSAVELRQRHFDYIAARFDDCLCVACLHELKRESDAQA